MRLRPPLFDSQVLEDYFDRSGQHGFTPSICLTRPESGGSIRLRSKDPFDKPLLDPNYLGRAEDVQRFIEGELCLTGLISGYIDDGRTPYLLGWSWIDMSPLTFHFKSFF
jgi:hypothetical protein